MWNDITSHKGGGWFEESDTGTPAIFETSGWITHETTNYVTICSTMERSGDLKGHDTVIPKGCIIKIYDLRKYVQIRNKTQEST